MSDESSRMPLLEHIKELRTRLLVCVIALAIATLISFIFSQKIMELLARPIGGLSAMASIDVTENMSAFMKISLLCGVILSLPVILFEIFAFIMPGLNPNERTWIWMAIPSATFFFVAGVAFTYFIMLPAALPFLINFMGITTSPRPNTYFNFVGSLMFWVGVIFEMPLVMYVLARLKIVSAKTLLKQWRIALAGSAILAALITPTSDPVNMGLMMLPLFALYLTSIIFAVFARRERKPRKPISKRTKVILTLITIVLIVGLTLLYVFFTNQFVNITDQIVNTLVQWWKATGEFFSSIGEKLSTILG